MKSGQDRARLRQSYHVDLLSPAVRAVGQQPLSSIGTDCLYHSVYVHHCSCIKIGKLTRCRTVRILQS